MSIIKHNDKNPQTRPISIRLPSLEYLEARILLNGSSEPAVFSESLQNNTSALAEISIEMQAGASGSNATGLCGDANGDVWRPKASVRS